MAFRHDKGEMQTKFEQLSLIRIAYVIGLFPQADKFDVGGALIFADERSVR